MPNNSNQETIDTTNTITLTSGTLVNLNKPILGYNYTEDEIQKIHTAIQNSADINSDDIITLNSGQMIDFRYRALDLGTYMYTNYDLEQILEKVQKRPYISQIYWGENINDNTEFDFTLLVWPDANTPRSMSPRKKIKLQMIKNNFGELNLIEEPEIFPKNYIVTHKSTFYPSDFTHILLSAHVYKVRSFPQELPFIPDWHNFANQFVERDCQEDVLSHLKDWRIEHKYHEKILLYANHTTHNYILTIQGTKTIYDWRKTNFKIFVRNSISNLHEEVKHATQESIKKAKEDDYFLSMTGHSLGAHMSIWALGIANYNQQYPYGKTVAVENPGNGMCIFSHEFNNNRNSVDKNNKAVIRTELDSLNIMEYVSDPNWINCIPAHVSKKLYHIHRSDSNQSLWKKYSHYMYKSHKINYIISNILKNTKILISYSDDRKKLLDLEYQKCFLSNDNVIDQLLELLCESTQDIIKQNVRSIIHDPALENILSNKSSVLSDLSTQLLLLKHFYIIENDQHRNKQFITIKNSSTVIPEDIKQVMLRLYIMYNDIKKILKGLITLDWIPTQSLDTVLLYEEQNLGLRETLPETLAEAENIADQDF